MPENVYVFRIGQLGDTVVALPAIRRIAELHPGARCVLITNSPSKASLVTAWDVLKHTGVFADVLFYNARSVRSLAKLAFACRLRGRKVLYYLSPARNSKQLRRDRVFFTAGCGFRQITGMVPTSSPGMRERAGNLRRLPRECDRLLALVDPGSSPPPAPLLTPPPEAQATVATLLEGFRNRSLIAFGPGSKMPAKKWFLDRYVQVAERLVAGNPQRALVVFGGREDWADGERIVDAVGHDRAINLAGKTNIIESAAALALCDLYVGNDTGTMHLAAAMGVRCVALFTSRENRNVWLPVGSGHSILRHDLPCSGCMLERCVVERMRCLDLISVDDVCAAVEQAPAPLRVLT